MIIPNFPTPYPDELIYSAIARYAIHNAIQSPKYLIEELFNNRNLTPTYDLPCYINILANYLPPQHDAINLIGNHTLLPIYKFFQPNSMIEYVFQAMCGNQYKPLHTKLGKNASRIKSTDFFRFCPVCWQEQIKKYGEIYWKRNWQVTGYEYCTTHKQPLFVSLLSCTGLDRKFYYADLKALKESSQIVLNPQDLKHHLELASSIEELLTSSVTIVIQDYTTLSRAYFNILKDNSLLLSRKNINYEKIRQVILDYWGESFLAYYQLADLVSENCWLKNIFRKHRKAFSYIEHLLVLKALVPEQNPIETYRQYIEVASTGIEEEAAPICINNKVDRILSEDQKQWTKLIQQISVKQARQCDQAMYARLYRNHKDWLLLTNKSAVTLPSSLPKPRVDWKERDRQFVKQLIKIRDELLEDLDSPQWTKKFFIRQLGSVSMIEKNWNFFPLTAAFLARYAESIDCYQIRRLARTIFVNTMRIKTIRRVFFYVNQD